MIVRADDESNTTIGAAALQCASKSSKLVSFSSCQSLEATVTDIKDFAGINNAQFWLGLFSPGIDNKHRGNRNFLSDGNDWIIDSYVQN